MITWKKAYNRPLCIFRTKEDFKLTGRGFNSKGTDFSVDDSEYADDTVVLFDSRTSLEVHALLLVKHFLKFGMEINVGDRHQVDKLSKT